MIFNYEEFKNKKCLFSQTFSDCNIEHDQSLHLKGDITFSAILEDDEDSEPLYVLDNGTKVIISDDMPIIFPKWLSFGILINEESIGFVFQIKEDIQDQLDEIYISSECLSGGSILGLVKAFKDNGYDLCVDDEQYVNILSKDSHDFNNLDELEADIKSIAEKVGLSYSKSLEDEVPFIFSRTKSRDDFFKSIKENNKETVLKYLR